MSKESAKACFVKIRTDKDFENQIKQAKTRTEREEIIKNAGFEFTDEDWDAAAQEVRDAYNTEQDTLSDEMLEAVVGGAFSSFPRPMYGLSPFIG